MENVQTTKKEFEYPTPEQMKFALSIINQKIKASLEAKEYTYDDLNSHLVVITFTPPWAQKEFTLIYSYPFNGVERNTPKFVINGFLDCKDDFKLQFIE